EIDAEPEIARWGTLNLRFHMALYSACGSRRLLELIEQQYPAADRHVRVLLSHLQYREASQEEHRRLLALCRQGDIPRAGALLKDHFEAARSRLAGFLARGRS